MNAEVFKYSPSTHQFNLCGLPCVTDLIVVTSFVSVSVLILISDKYVSRCILGGQQLYHVGVAMETAPEPFQRTKVVSFVPRVKVVNLMRNYIVAVAQANRVQQAAASTGKPHGGSNRSGTNLGGSSVKAMLRVDPRSSKPLHCVYEGADDRVCLSLITYTSSEENNSAAPKDSDDAMANKETTATREEWTWSGPFRTDEALETVVKLTNTVTGEVCVVRVVVQRLGATALLSFALEELENSPLFEVRNLSSVAVHYFQSDDSNGGNNIPASAAAALRRSGAQRGTTVLERALPGDRQCFGWDLPDMPGKVVVLSFEGDAVILAVNIEEVSNEQTNEQPTSPGYTILILSVRCHVLNLPLRSLNRFAVLTPWPELVKVAMVTLS
jgi:hypothetical protein